MPYSHPVDINIGQKIRELRLARGMSQENLGNKIGITFQQVQKYEKGVNRILASRLYDLAKVLAVDIVHFFSKSDTLHEHENSFEYNHCPESKEILVLVREYTNIKDKKIRSAIYSLIKSLSHDENNGSNKTK